MAKNRTEAPNRRRSLSDPLAAALLPPANETPVEKELRLKRETEAKQVSDRIDEMIRQERIHRKKTRAEVNVLLLGQSESGKSTTLKQFQLLHTPAAFHAERIAWRAVIYLNLVRSIKRILDVLSPESDIVVDDHDDVDSLETASVIISSNGRPPSAISGTKVPNYEIYRSRLEPLTELEERLIRLLSCPDEDEATHLAWQPFPNSSSLPNYPASGNGRPAPTIAIPQIKPSVSSPVSPVGDISPGGSSGSQPSKGKEVSVHTSINWKKTFALGGKSKSPKSAHSGEIEGWWEDPEDPVHALNACAPAMQELWKDPKVRQRLQEKRLRLEESSGFYLDEIPRITAKKYIPTDADVLKARLKTMGVVEHTFLIQSGSNRGVEWRIYDVGGARNQRQAWAPYFEDGQSVFSLPYVVSSRPLEDSLLLWQAVTSNKLLAKVNIAKLDAGVRLNHHMTSYGDRPNDYDSVSKYFRNKFGAIHHSATPNKERELYIHFTAVTDTRRTVTIISTVRDIIIKGNLRNLKLV
ncbi:guanine nucleotide binding protein, alpha subunit [Armillaria borealis]|uniref:Guanine nucleotide binding protein, alpha subunit n=1 Tax=Armillaria borealis TaxID=47425 RepID=A0AA39J475_9AGAR|nr:guanine nucleotide binding protein, alpha subunit [Armillaria borealis]